MKLKIIFPITLSIFIGILCGRTVFSQYRGNIQEVVVNTEPIYLLQQGVYSSVESMEENTMSLSDYLYVKQDDKYYVYLGITGNKELADKLKNNYSNVDIYVKENNISNQGLILKIRENDKTIQEESDKKNLLSLSKKSLEIYEETMKAAKSY